MQVRLLKPIAFRRVGVILDVPGGVAETWVNQGKAAPYVDSAIPFSPPVIEHTVPAAAAVERTIPRRRENTGVSR